MAQLYKTNMRDNKRNITTVAIANPFLFYLVRSSSENMRTHKHIQPRQKIASKRQLAKFYSLFLKGR